MKTQQEYWENQIIDWENGTYKYNRDRKTPVIEQFAEIFRETVRKRRVILYQLLKEHRPRSVLEFGCGSGDFVLGLLKDGIVERAVAVDISSQAIAYAKHAAQQQGLADKVTFITSSVKDFDFKKYLPVDFVWGLGLTPYLTEEEMEHLFREIKTSKFFFDVHFAGLNFVNALHIFYMMIRQHPFYRKFSKEDILRRMQAWGVSSVEFKYQRPVHYFEKLKT